MQRQYQINNGFAIHLKLKPFEQLGKRLARKVILYKMKAEDLLLMPALHALKRKAARLPTH
jgi:hypothetical protein